MQYFNNEVRFNITITVQNYIAVRGDLNKGYVFI